MKRVTAPLPVEAYTAWVTSNPDATWKHFKDEHGGKDRLGERVYQALERAQRGLCAFCEIGLEPPLGAQVEHFHPKEDSGPDCNWGLEYRNFTAACEGGEKINELPARSGLPVKANLHCGARKGKKVLDGLILDPREIPASPCLWELDPKTGELHPREVACAHSGVPAVRVARTRDELGLNVPVLTRHRRTALAKLDDEAQALWDGQSDESLGDAYATLVPIFLGLDEADRLHPFFTTLRCALGPAAESWLAEHPEVF